MPALRIVGKEYHQRAFQEEPGSITDVVSDVYDLGVIWEGYGEPEEVNRQSLKDRFGFELKEDDPDGVVTYNYALEKYEDGRWRLVTFL